MFEKLFEDDAIMRHVAEKISEYQVMLYNKSITESEYRELTEDLLDLKRIDNLADSRERRIKLKKLFEALLLLSQLALPPV